MKDPIFLFLKAHVAAHNRVTRNGKAVTVQAYDTKVAPHMEHLKKIDRAVKRRARVEEVTKYDRAHAQRYGQLPSRKVQDRIAEESADDMRDAVHALAKQNHPEGSALHQLVQHGHEAFGAHGDDPSTIDPEGFAEHYKRLFPNGPRSA